METAKSFNAGAARGEQRPVMVFVDDRPTTFSAYALARPDVAWILLRYRDHGLPAAYLAKTASIPAFYRDREAPFADQIEAFSQWCGREGLKPSRMLNASEPEQRFAHALARAMGMPALEAAQVESLRNKVAMKDKFREIGFDTAEYAPVATPDELVDFGRRHGWPVVVKPQEGFACIDTYLIASEERAAAHELRSGTAWMVESYVGGREWECCALIRHGRVLDTYLSYMPARPLEIVEGAMNANITLNPQPHGFPVDTQAMVQKLVDGMRLDHGYMHLEFFESGDGKYKMGEAALRLAGCEIPANHGLAYGFDIFGALVDIHLGRDVALDYTARRCVGDLLLPARAGKILKMTTPEELLAMPGVLECKPRMKVGDVADPRRASHTCSAVVHIEGNSLGHVLSRMENVSSAYTFVTDRGRVRPARARGMKGPL